MDPGSSYSNLPLYEKKLASDPSENFKGGEGGGWNPLPPLGGPQY